MKHHLLLLIALLVASSSAAFAQSFEERVRSRIKTSRHSSGKFAFTFDVGGGMAQVERIATFGQGQDGTSFDWTEEPFGAPDNVISWSSRMGLQWRDSAVWIEYTGQYGLLEHEGLNIDFNFGAATIPQDTAIDFRSSVHHISAEYRRDLLALDDAENYEIFGLIGLSYDIIRMAAQAPDAPIDADSRRMRELTPLPMLGLGWKGRMGDHSFTLLGRFAQLPEVTTLQKDDEADVDQEATYYELAADYEYHFSKWFYCGLYLKYQSWDHTLKSDLFEQNFEQTLTTLGARLGIRF